MLIIRKDLFSFILLISFFSVNFAFPTTLVHNTQHEIDSCMGKVQLKFIRTWGGDDEADENCLFKYPYSIDIDNKNVVFISDYSNSNIKVFNREGKYINTIGQKGQGPGDLFGPGPISIAPDGLLWVGELGGRRIQSFNSSGKSQTIIKYKEIPMWMSITSKNEIAIHSHSRTFLNRTLLTIYSAKGKPLYEIGKYHDPSKSQFGSEHLIFSKDKQDNFVVANTWIPVIRRYSLLGQLKSVITFETPFFIPIKVALNAEGNEITRSGDEKSGNTKIKTGENSYTIDLSKKNEKWKKHFLCNGLETGPDNNLYLVTANREITEKENQATVVTVIASNVYRNSVDYNIAENSDILSLYVFNPQGKIIAATKLTTFCDRIFVSGNRLFVVDGSLNLRILEYEIKITL